MAGQPKAPFYAMLFLVVAGLVGYAVYRADVFAPAGKNNGPGPGNLDPHKLGQGEIPKPTPESTAGANEPGVTTVKEYTFTPAERLPPVKGASAYKLEDNTVRFALNVWAGWGPIIFANDGFKAGKVWKTPQGEEFKVDLVLIDDPVQMRNAYTAGNVQIGWATLDMVPLLLDGMVGTKDSRIMPRIYQQVDWSNGGDGIVVRQNIKTVGDLRQKKLVLAQNSPSQYFALNMLVAAGIQPNQVDMKYTKTAFEAAAAFQADPSIAGAVSWAPDIYNLSEKVPGNRLLVTTKDANKLIADVWFARADFAKDHPGMVEALVRGIFDGMVQLKDQKNKEQCAKLMGEGYGIPASETIGMFGDAHSTNWAENYQFFMNQNNPTNFEHVWRQAYYLYRSIGAIGNAQVPFDEVMDFSIIEKLGKEAKYKSQKDEYKVILAPKSISSIQAESDEILTNTVIIHFFPNSWDLNKMITKQVDGKTVEELYDPSVNLVLQEIAKLTEQFGAARVIIQGHTDGSLRGQIPADLVKELSLNRANAVKQGLLDKFKELDPNKFNVQGMGWDKPADRNDPDNHAKNRRVEIKVYSAEKQ